MTRIFIMVSCGAKHGIPAALRGAGTAAHTMVDMRGWSFPIGRFLGVDVRIHTFFLLLLGLSISYASVSGASGARGFALWLLLLLAVAVREAARAVGAAWFGLDVRS